MITASGYDLPRDGELPGEMAGKRRADTTSGGDRKSGSFAATVKLLDVRKK
jgi:hypothetical protein